jgi:hypothetical protein
MFCFSLFLPLLPTGGRETEEKDCGFLISKEMVIKPGGEECD